MQILTIKRISPRIYPNNFGTFGVLINNFTNIPFAVTLEPPWKNNEKDISCIPDGIYVCRRILSPKHGHTFEVCDVFEREHIEFHWGNLKEDTEGCILVAEEYGLLYQKAAILESKRTSGKGFNEFMRILSDVNKFQLNILWC